MKNSSMFDSALVDFRESIANIPPLMKLPTLLVLADEIKEALIYQMTHGVRWRESVLNMAELGITEMIEVGPGSVLTGLCGRITDKITAKKLEI